MKIAKRLFVGVLLACPGMGASAAVITWGPVTSITSPAGLDQVGSFVTAVNAGSSDGTLAIAGTDITFHDGAITAAVTGTITASGNGGFYSPATGNPNLDTVLDSHSYLAGANPGSRGRIDLTGLTVGQQYRLQVIGVSDDRACCGDRVQTVDDGNGNTSGGLQRTLAQSTIGTFTAGSATESFFVSGTNDPGISGYELRAVPEPAMFGLISVGAIAALRRRHRSN